MKSETARAKKPPTASAAEPGTLFEGRRVDPTLELVHGCSATPVFRIAPNTAVVVGTSSVCDFRVVARRVRDLHLILSWNGAELRIVHACERPELRVDGRPVGLPFTLRKPAHVGIGDAVFVVHVGGFDPKANLADGRDEDQPTVIASVEPSLRKLRAGAVRARRESDVGGRAAGERA